MNKMLYRNGLLDYLRVKGIDMQFRVINRSKFRNITSDIREIVFFFKNVDRNRDNYIMPEPQYFIMLCSCIYKWMKIAPKFDFRVQKPDFNIE